MATDHDLLTSTEAAAAWGVSTYTVRKWAREGKVKTVALPSGRRRFLRSDVDAVLRPTEAEAAS